MGLFDWLKPQQSNVETLADVIWLTTKAKYAGMVKAVESSLKELDSPVAVLLVAHFQDCLNELQQVSEATDRRPSPLHASSGKPKGYARFHDNCRRVRQD